MDIKKLTRGDAIVAVGALVVFIFSFMSFRQAEVSDEVSWNAWSGDFVPGVPALVLIPIVGAVLYIVGGLMPRPPQFAGLTLRQWGTPLAAVSPIYALWGVIGGPDGTEAGIGGIFILLGTLALAAGVIATEMVPALKAPLGLGGGGSAAPAGAYGGQQAPYGAPQQQGAPYGGAPQQAQYGGAPAPAPAPSAADPSFQPYWFSVPDQRQLVDAQTNAPAGSLNPGVWYLAVQQHGQGLLVEVDGVRGVLWNVSGIQKS
ncbi:hypothetical protein OG216_31695 [Streptomycetaceae bacterium NBC_01309]